MNWAPLAEWLTTTGMHNLMVNIYWMFPLMETLHFTALTVLFGALLVVDGRIIGMGKFINMKAAMAFIPVAIIAFAVNLLTGIMFLAADPYNYLANSVFQWKMGLIIIAGINALWFWFGEHKELVQLADGQDAPFRAKVIALVSIVLWVLIIIAGRMIPYGPGGSG
jgi:hypothetical protein